MNKHEITLWMDDREYDALRRALLAQNTDPRTEMQKRLDACYRELVPRQEQERIMEAADRPGGSEMDARLGSAMFRVIEGGECRCFGVAHPCDAVDAASRLRRYLNGGGAEGFAASFVQQTPITEMKYIDHVMDCLCDYEQAADVFHIDLDSGTFSILDPENGWWTYPVRDITDLVRCGLPDEDARFAWLQHELDGRRIDTDERCYLLCGDRALRASDIDVLEYVETEDGVSTFSLEVCTDMETVFGTRLAKDDDSNVVIYASFDANKGAVDRNLDIGLLREVGSEYFVYPLDAGTADAIMQKMDDYCMEEDGLHLTDWLKQNATPQFWQEIT